MGRACSLVAIASEDIPRLTAALVGAFGQVETTVSLLDIPVLNALAPEVLVVDIDRLETEPHEALRRLRFVLPDCVIVVYTGSTPFSVIRGCHSAGANCLLSKHSSEEQLTSGLRSAMWNGCFTDPRCVA